MTSRTQSVLLRRIASRIAAGISGLNDARDLRAMASAMSPIDDAVHMPLDGVYDNMALNRREYWTIGVMEFSRDGGNLLSDQPMGWYPGICSSK